MQSSAKPHTPSQAPTYLAQVIFVVTSCAVRSPCRRTCKRCCCMIKASHRDTEKAEAMLGTLALTLPSIYLRVRRCFLRGTSLTWTPMRGEGLQRLHWQRWGHGQAVGAQLLS